MITFKEYLISMHFYILIHLIIISVVNGINKNPMKYYCYPLKMKNDTHSDYITYIYEIVRKEFKSRWQIKWQSDSTY